MTDPSEPPFEENHEFVPRMAPGARRYVSRITGVGLHIPTPWQDRKAHLEKANLRSLLRGAPEAVVKISRGGKGYASVAAALDYVSREGQLPLLTEEGEKILGHAALEDLKDEWRYGGVPLPSNGAATEVFGVILSMPEGTSCETVLKSAAEVSATMLPGHQYALVLHEPHTDPSPNAAAHPHVHVVIKAMSVRGIRFHPTPTDIDDWRKLFAVKLRERGVDAAASWRSERFVNFQSHLEDQNITPSMQGVREKLTKAEDGALLRYAKMAYGQLHQNEKDVATLMELMAFLTRKLGVKTLQAPALKERGQSPRLDRDIER